MPKIIGNTTATPNPRPDWNQTDATKADFIKNKPDLNKMAAVVLAETQKNIDAALNDINVDLGGVEFSEGSMILPEHKIEVDTIGSYEIRPYDINAIGDLNINIGDDNANILSTYSDGIGGYEVHLGQGNSENGYTVHTFIGNNYGEGITSICGTTIDLSVNGYSYNGTSTDTELHAINIGATSSNDDLVPQTNINGELLYNGKEVATKDEVGTQIFSWNDSAYMGEEFSDGYVINESLLAIDSNAKLGDFVFGLSTGNFYKITSVDIGMDEVTIEYLFCTKNEEYTPPILASIDLSTFDTNGQIIETYTDGTKKTTIVEFDTDGNPIKMTDSNGNVTTLIW